MAIIHSDSFDRANSTTVPGTPEIGGPYTPRLGNWGIFGNTLYASSSTTEGHITFPGSANFDTTFYYSAIGSNSGLLFRWVDANNTWLFQILSTAIQVYRRIAGAWTQYAGWTGATTTGTEFRVIAIGTRLWFYRSGKLLWELEDHWWNTQTTMGFRHSQDVASRVDWITVDNAPVSPVPTATQDAEVSSDARFDSTRELGAAEITPVSLASDSNATVGIYKGRDTAVADEGNIP